MVPRLAQGAEVGAGCRSWRRVPMLAQGADAGRVPRLAHGAEELPGGVEEIWGGVAKLPGGTEVF